MEAKRTSRIAGVPNNGEAQLTHGVPNNVHST